MLGQSIRKGNSPEICKNMTKIPTYKPIHFGAIPGRSAIDAACTLTHDIERAWGQEDTLTALAFDIKGAFDAITKERLTERLWQQKIPLPLIQ